MNGPSAAVSSRDEDPYRRLVVADLPVASVLVRGEVLEASTVPVTNPARTTEIIGYCALARDDQVDRAVAAAVEAFPRWSALTVHARAELLLEAAVALEAGQAARAELLVKEVGKVRDEALADAAGASSLLRYFAALAGELAEPFGDGTPADLPLPGRATVRHVPMGPIAIIAPWNTPIYLTFMALAPALLAGNTVVVKPPEEAPLALSDALAVLAETLPPGVLSVVPGLGARTGGALTAHPQIRKILFTGSIETGREVMRNAAGHIAAVGMELGGNDPAVLLDDVLIDQGMLRELTGGVFGLSGQICYNIKRIYVHKSRLDEFVAAFVAIAARLVVGDPADPATTIGPVTTRAGRDRLAALVDDARAVGATVTEVGSA